MENIILALLGLAAVFAGRAFMKESLLFKRGTVKTTAVILENFAKQDFRNKPVKYTKIEYEFNSVKYTEALPYNMFEKRIGAQIKIALSPAAPRGPRRANAGEYAFPLVFIAAGIIIILKAVFNIL